MLVLDKKQLRKSILHELTTKSTEEKQLIEKDIYKTLFSTELWKISKVIGITISRHVEWDTQPIIQKAWKQGKLICIPKSNPNKHKMTFYKINSFAQVEKQHHSLFEPIPAETEAVKKNQIDLLIVPGLLFDKTGFRIGFGGGYYDRFLVDFPNETLSLLSQSQLLNKIPTERFDLPVNYLIVENELIKTGQR